MNPATEDRMGNRKNLYVRDADLETWERAEQLAGEPISVLVSRLLRNYVRQRQTITNRIVVEVEDHDGNVTRKAFQGRMLVTSFESHDPNVLIGTGYNAAQGAKGRIAVWIQRRNDDYAKGLWIYPDIAEMAADYPNMTWPRDFVAAVGSALGEEYAEEIDL